MSVDMSDQAVTDVAVIGAGPIGLAAASHLEDAGLSFVVFEAGSAAGHNISEWGHVRLFTDWESVVDPLSRQLLELGGWTAPPLREFPTGEQIVGEYLAPLAKAHESRVQYDSEVTALSRLGRDKLASGGRDDLPFVVRVHSPAGVTDHLARNVIDASGTWQNPNPAGASGLSVPGESDSSHISYGMPDVLGASRDRFAGKTTLVIGAGHSAANVLLDLTELALLVPGTRPVWAIRRPAPDRAYGLMEQDELPERGKVGLELRDRVDDGRLELEVDFAVGGFIEGQKSVVVEAMRRDGSVRRMEVDEVVIATGQRPDLEMTRELRLDLDPALDSPVGLAPLIDPNIHSCVTVPVHGVDVLAHPEKGYFTVGIKSYGRAPTFLMSTGYMQVESVVGEIARQNPGSDPSGSPRLVP